jgi:hypothetical protein
LFIITSDKFIYSGARGVWRDWLLKAIEGQRKLCQKEEDDAGTHNTQISTVLVFYKNRLLMSHYVTRDEPQAGEATELEKTRLS